MNSMRKMILLCGLAALLVVSTLAPIARADEFPRQDRTVTENNRGRRHGGGGRGGGYYYGGGYYGGGGGYYGGGSGWGWAAFGAAVGLGVVEMATRPKTVYVQPAPTVVYQTPAPTYYYPAPSYQVVPGYTYYSYPSYGGQVYYYSR